MLRFSVRFEGKYQKLNRGHVVSSLGLGSGRRFVPQSLDRRLVYLCLRTGFLALAFGLRLVCCLEANALMRLAF